LPCNKKILIIFSYLNRFWIFRSNKYIALDKYLKSTFGVHTKNLALYEQALTHKSYKRSFSHNNERLELLGDAVLSLIVTEFLLHKFPEKKEGELSIMRTHFVRRETLNSIAKLLEIDKVLKYSKFIEFEDASKHNIFGNALEALTGALFLDKGYSDTNRIIFSKVLSPVLNNTNIFELEMNYKGKLLEWCQQNSCSIEFNILESYMNKKQYFEAKVIINSQLKGTGKANKKKSAEQIASMHAYNSVKNTTN